MGWKRELKNNICTIEELGEYIPIPHDQTKKLQKIIELHPMSITAYYLSLINRNDPDDPVRKMIIPSLREFEIDGSYDTSGELDNTVINGLQHKYDNTALVTMTNQCTAYCRYCFRKRVVGLPDEDVKEKIQTIAKYIRNHSSIHNVLISGGDPLILDNDLLKFILKELGSIATLDFIRFGTKVPVVFPQRILDDDRLVRMFSRFSNQKKQLYIVTHFNHPREITRASSAAVACLRNAGLVVNNQCVLMRGVNDSPQILEALFRGLIRIGVNPYYLFQCRPVKRVKNHFQVSIKRGIEIVEKTRARLDGHSKRFKYIMSHVTGKIEIVGLLDQDIVLKYHQAQNHTDNGKVFRFPLKHEAAWVDDLMPTPVYAG